MPRHTVTACILLVLGWVQPPLVAQSIFENYQHGPITIEEKDVVYFSKDIGELFIHADLLLSGRYSDDQTGLIDTFIRNTGRRHQYFLESSGFAVPDSFHRLEQNEFSLRVARKNALDYIQSKYGHLKSKPLVWTDSILEFGKYNFAKSEFPLDLSRVGMDVGGTCLDLFFQNGNAFPGLFMNEQKGMAFLQSRKDDSGVIDRKVPCIFVFSIERYRDSKTQTGTLLNSDWYRFDEAGGACPHRLLCNLKSVYVFLETKDGEVKLFRRLQARGEG